MILARKLFAVLAILGFFGLSYQTDMKDKYATMRRQVDGAIHKGLIENQETFNVLSNKFQSSVNNAFSRLINYHKTRADMPLPLPMEV